jgi:hypothetical protein
MLSQLLLSAGVTLVLWALFKAASRIIRSFNSPLRSIGGPKSSHWFYGNYGDLMRSVSRCYHLSKALAPYTK